MGGGDETSKRENVDRGLRTAEAGTEETPSTAWPWGSVQNNRHGGRSEALKEKPASSGGQNRGLEGFEEKGISSAQSYSYREVRAGESRHLGYLKRRDVEDRGQPDIFISCWWDINW